MRPTAQLFALASILPSALAWGSLGHETVAYIATNFVSAETKTYFQDILGDTTTSYLVNVATWADTYRYTDDGSFSSPFHYIDALDDPPTTCGVDYDRDCGSEGCIVSAIQNYTQIIQDGRYSAEHKLDAARFLVHFIGDIHQPLHNENLDTGGNDIDVTYNSEDTNLHHIWDSEMPEQFVGGYSIDDANTWATSLTEAIKSGTYACDAAGWLDGIDLDDPVASSVGWATDSNAYVCSTVMPDGISALEGTDLSTDYYKTAIPVIELQIAKAGYRLAAWFNLLATGSTGL